MPRSDIASKVDGIALSQSSGSPVQRKRKREADDHETGFSKADRRSPEQPEQDSAGIPVAIIDEAYRGITQKMLNEQRALEMEATKQEQDLLFQAKAKFQKHSVEEELEAKQERLNVLRHLLDKSTHFAAYIKKIMGEERKKLDLAAKQVKVGKKIKGKKMSQLLKDKETLDCEASSSGGTALEQPKVPILQPKLIVGKMRDYQLEGLEWLMGLTLSGVNGILADEMGLGKTIQVISLICYLIERGTKGPFLVVGPLSTLSNWVAEFKRFAPKLSVILYHGPMAERRELWPKFQQLTEIPEGRAGGIFPIIVTSFEVALKDLVPLQHIKWEMLIVDEGHRIKNFQCKLVIELKKYITNHRLLLTGTPLQNNLSELWSLLNFLLPDIFSEFQVFQSWLDTDEFSSLEGGMEETAEKVVKEEEKDRTLSTLHKILHPFMLRRVKADVELDLPPKKELLVYTPLTPVQDKLYRAILDQSIYLHSKPKEADLEKAPTKRRRTCTTTRKLYNFDLLNTKDFEEVYNASLLSEVRSQKAKSSSQESSQSQGYMTSLNPNSPFMDLRKVVNHPYLLKFPLIPGTKELLIDKGLVTSSGKMLVLDAMLQKLLKQGHKMLIFSQFTMMLDILEDYLSLRHLRYCRLDGSRSIANRTENIELFSTDPEVSVFLLSTRAGGLGINLTAADTVIIYDSDWNPQCDLQAQDRCHRIGQTRPVVVYRLITDGTVDRRMVERATGKRRLEKIVIKNGRFHGNKNSLTDEATGLSPQELLDLINSKDFMKTIQSNGLIFSDEELEQLLDRSDLLGTKDRKNKVKSCDLFSVVDSSAEEGLGSTAKSEC